MNDIGSRQADEHRVGAVADILRRDCRLRANALERGDGSRIGVEHAELMARCVEAGGHVPAHAAEADKADN
jgi:hypothetical protein